MVVVLVRFFGVRVSSRPDTQLGTLGMVNGSAFGSSRPIGRLFVSAERRRCNFFVSESLISCTPSVSGHSPSV